MWEALTNIVPLGLYYTAPLLIIALGGLFSERSGIVNIALEGLLGVGAFASALFLVSTYSTLGNAAIWLSLLVGALAGCLFSWLHAFASVTMKADQVISGTAINLLSLSLTVYLARVITKSANVQIIRGFLKGDIPFLSKIPVIGPLFFSNAYITTYLVFAIVVISWFILYKRPFGFHLRACGENPQAADSMGIKVVKMRYIGVLISGALAGLGGAITVTTYAGQFSDSTTYNGLGFLALAALIFGKWNPWGVLGASFFFGFAKTLAELAKVFESLRDLPNIYFNTFPYVITLIALMIFSKNAHGPKAAGEPYDPGKR